MCGAVGAAGRSAPWDGLIVGKTGYRLFGLVAACVVLGIAADAFAWGPATHVKLASDLLANLWLLPTAVAAVISRHRRYFVYGNVATDTVFAKKMSRTKQICHHWQTGFSLLDSAETEEGQAFAYGYLSHLAADTVAHNKFLPRQMAISRSTVTFGHLYWEVRADSLIDRAHWHELRAALRASYPEPERLLEAHLRETLLSFRANRLLFKRMNLLASERGWRRTVDFWSALSRHPLEARVIDDYHTESFERVLDVLTRGQDSLLLYEDPNGNGSLSYAKAQRRQLRQMNWAKIPHVHVIEEAASGHAPARARMLAGSAPERT